MQTNIKKFTTEQIEKTGYGKNFWPMLMVFYALFVIRNIFSFEFPISVYLIWIAVMAFVFNDTEMKGLLISFIPLTPGFQSKFAVLVCMIVLLVKYGKQLRFPLFVFFIPLLMFWEFLHMGDGFSSTAEYLSGFAPLMVLMIVVSMPDKEEDTSFFSRVLAFSLAVGSIILIANTVISSNQSLLSLMQEGFRLGAVEEAEDYQITYNSNGLGYLCNIAIVGLLTNIYFEKSKKFDYYLMGLLIVVGCLTVSRTFLLCLAGTFVLYILLQERPIEQKIKVFVAIVGILLLALGGLKIAAPNIIENYVERFNAEDITGGRSYLLDFYNEFITSSPKRFWYGIGIQSIAEKVSYLEGVAVKNVPHNGYQQMIIAWGMIGLFLMMLFILNLVLYAKKKNPHASLMCYLPVILLLTNILAGQFVTSGTKLLSLVFIYLMICNGGKETVNDLNDSEKHK